MADNLTDIVRKKIARKGRKGDTHLRNVDGKLSHVNPIEAKVIDALGPIGEAWVKDIGVGTINPKTGLREYGFGSWLKKRVTPPRNSSIWEANKGLIIGGALGLATGGIGFLGAAGMGALGGLGGQALQSHGAKGVWKPMSGKWGVFGQTQASKDRDAANAAEATRKETFKTFAKDNQDMDIAAMYAADGGAARVEDFMTGGTPEDTTDASTMSGKDFKNVVSKYDPRQEGEVAANTQRTIDAKASDVATGEFGNLTESTSKAATSNFSSFGDFGAEFKEKEMMDKAKIEYDQIYADSESDKKDLHDGFNEAFWADAMNWSDAKSA